MPRPARSADAGRVRLVVQADDHGACPAVSDGILRCFQAGVVTQASVIVPAPDAPRAIAAALAAGLPLGAHLALLCEWEGLRWGPLTAAPSLRAVDGAFPDDLARLRAQADLGEAAAELRAQLRAATTAGVRLTHLESHVRVLDPGLLARISAEFGLPCRDEVPAPGVPMALDSLWHLSLQDPATKAEALARHVAGLGPGTHMVVAHPAEDRPELLTLCSPDSRRWKWARDIRVSDTAALLDPRFLASCAERDVELTALPAPG
ncbi:ChbG/HpnK family deacetylase [Streptomyces sp. DSM 44915]|uniref:ChbG/HpnK family deacetylase n=1 Tax=Streptomyces chisholmiae TaxID=3075540 RepID=A0ABU2JQN1_9ACTN|nr:ChbG/HpnK family deacetylase [Streptomyces sp. DSM 44915]MDT0266824.1 ChbG/HpnK family deacetylase [Streptomyces sp. DSM 44915]